MKTLTQQLARRVKRLPLQLLFGRWRQPCPFDDGYTVILPSPMDMPFMLRLGLEGLKKVDTANCREILIVPDGLGNDGGQGLRKVATEFKDTRIRFVGLNWRHKLGVRISGPTRFAAIHWLMVIAGTEAARCEYAFLHDADAFFVDTDALERQYREAKERRLFTYGIEPRWDPFFVRNRYTIPGTWELMYSTRWARSRSPIYLKPGRIRTSLGDNDFDSMLYAQFMDYATGQVAVMSDAPKLVHFNGTICAFRLFRDAKGKPVTDELFRVLLLSLIEDAFEVPRDVAVCPTVADLAMGLNKVDAPVLYQSDVNQRGYSEFRGMLQNMLGTAAFHGVRADRIVLNLAKFDQHFGYVNDAPVVAAFSAGEMRRAAIR